MPCATQKYLQLSLGPKKYRYDHHRHRHYPG
jgi:hypothetical protein